MDSKAYFKGSTYFRKNLSAKWHWISFDIFSVFFLQLSDSKYKVLDCKKNDTKICCPSFILCPCWEVFETCRKTSQISSGCNSRKWLFSWQTDRQTDKGRPHASALCTDHSQVPSPWAPTTKPSIWSLLPCCQLTKPILSSMRTGWKEFEIPFPFSSVCLPSNNCHFVPQTKQQNAWERGENGLVRRGRSTSAWESMKIFW